MKAEDLKMVVKEKYSEIANQSKLMNQSSCCESTCGCNDATYTIFSDDYTKLKVIIPMLIWDWAVVYQLNLPK